MVISVDPQVARTTSLEAFVDHVEARVQLSEPQSLILAADEFRALANDVDLVADHFNAQVKNYFRDGRMATNGPQSILLGKGRGFFLRANIWLPPKLEGPFREHERRLYSYGTAHDHNFTFMTVGYFGPGYATDLYHYDCETVAGFIGERVELHSDGRAFLPVGRVSVYEAKRDVHTQHAPQSLSISLNLVVADDRTQELDQYFFDVDSGRITGMPDFATIHQRATVVSLAGRLGNQQSVQLLSDLLTSAPCRRVREAAVEAIGHIPNVGLREQMRLVEIATTDKDPIVRARARAWLAAKLA